MIGRFLPTLQSLSDIDRSKRLIFQGCIISALLLLSVLLPRVLPQQFVPFILAFPLAVAFLLVILRWPGLRVSVVIIASMIVPLSIGTGTGSSVNAAMLALGGLVGVWLLERVVRRHPWQFTHSPTFTPLLALVIVATLSFIVGQLPWYTFAAHAPLPAQIGGLTIFLLSAMAFIWTAQQITKLRWLQLATWIFIALGSLHIAGNVVPQLGIYTRRIIPNGATGSLFWTWLTALVFSQMLLNQQLDKRWRTALGVLLFGILYVSLFKSRAWSSGWVPPLATIIVILWLGRPKLALLVTVFAGVVGIFQAQHLLNNLIWVGDNSYSMSTRVEAWLIVGEIAKVSPILGLGPANYYWYTPLFPIRGYFVQFNSHSQYVDLIAQTGILGLFCFFWFAGKVGQLGWQLRQRVPAGFPEAYVNGALGGLVGTLVAAALGDWVLPFVYNIGFTGFRASMLGWLFLGGLVALGRMFQVQNSWEITDDKTNSNHRS